MISQQEQVKDRTEMKVIPLPSNPKDITIEHVRIVFGDPRRVTNALKGLLNR